MIAGRPKAYEEIAVATLGEKQNELEQLSDARYATAFVGVSTIARNAGAHCQIDYSDDLIRLTERDREGRIKEEILTEDEFLDRLANLALTCHALRVAAELFRLEHLDRMPAAKPASRPRVAAELAKRLVGYAGLVRANVRFELPARILLEADEDSHEPGKTALDYLPITYALATLFPSSSALELRVTRTKAPGWHLQMAIADALAISALPVGLRDYFYLKLRYLAVVDPPSDTTPHRYRREGVRDGARLLTRDLAPLGELTMALPATREKYIEILDGLDQRMGILAEVLRTVEPPKRAIAARDDFLSTIEALGRAFRKNRRLVDSGRWNEVRIPSENLRRALRSVVRLGQCDERSNDD